MIVFVRLWARERPGRLSPPSSRVRVTTEETARHDIFLILLPAVALALGVLWAAIIPMWQIPDEPAHYAYIQSLGENSAWIPDQGLSRELSIANWLSGLDQLPFDSKARQPFARGSTWGPAESGVVSIPASFRTEIQINSYNPATSYPPGYYLVASLLYRALASEDILTIMFGLRIFSAVITSITVLICYLTLRLFFEERAMARAATFMVALSPMYIFMGMAVNVDVLVWLLFSIFLFLTTKALQEGLSWQMNLGLASVVGVGLWVKQTFLIGVFFYVLLLLFLRLRRSIEWTAILRLMLAFFGVILLLDGWLYFSGLILTSPGTPLHSLSVGGYVSHLLDSWRIYEWGLHKTFWGAFGWLDTPLSSTLYLILGFASIAGLVGYLTYLVVGARRGQPRGVATYFLMLVVFLAVALSIVNYSVITTGADWFLQGRYLFPLMAPFLAVVVTGLTWFLRQQLQQVIVIALIGAMVVFHVHVVFNYVVPRFYV